MKNILIIALMSLFATAAHAMGETPDTFCDAAFCTPEMKAVVAEYAAHPVAPSVEQAPILASGDCWHVHPSIGSDRTHHAMFLMENTIAGPWSRGLFSFFAPTNPYSGFDVDAARQRLNQSSGPGRAMQVNPDHATWAFPGEEVDIHYWTRMNQETGEMLLISRWMFHSNSKRFFDVRAFCRLKTH